jgi:hypothetical protein
MEELFQSHTKTVKGKAGGELSKRIRKSRLLKK